MMTCWCHIADSLSASARATMSVGPPAATGTMTRTGLLGYVPFGVCARPAPRRRLVVTTWAAESAIKSRRPSISVNPRCLDTRILSPCQAGDQSSTNWIDDIGEHNRHATRDLLKRCNICAAAGKNDVWSRLDQFRRVSPSEIGIGCGPSGVNPRIAALGPPA